MSQQLGPVAPPNMSSVLLLVQIDTGTHRKFPDPVLKTTKRLTENQYKNQVSDTKYNRVRTLLSMPRLKGLASSYRNGINAKQEIFL